MMDERDSDEKNVMGCREELRMGACLPLPQPHTPACLGWGKLCDAH